MTRRVVVFGGTGFIGLHVVQACVGEGYDVAVVVRPGGRVEHLAPLRGRVDVLVGDFTVKSEVRHALRDANDAIVLVGSTIPATGVLDPTHELFATVMPHVSFLDAAADAGVRRVVVASSGGTVYGNAVTLPTPEDAPLRPITPYGIAKMTIESYCGFYLRQFGLDTRVLRIANPYGPGQRIEAGQGIVGTAFAHLLRDEPVTLFSDGRTVRDFIYVEDVARAFVHTLAYTGDEWIFNVGSGEGIDLLDLLARIEAITGRVVSRTMLPARPFDVRANTLDTTRARHALGWRAAVPLDEGLRRTWEWYRSQAEATAS